ncbi:MAG: TonB-dependent receptor, partial [Bacteroidetes bacterium]|nr:TonB-dependent receptor [Bacteroidota bacterium]
MTMRTMNGILLMLVLFHLDVLGQGKGTIRGRIVDAKSREGLPAVNVKVKGTYFGASSDIEGNFLIPGVSPGSYTVEVSLIGYTTVHRTDAQVEESKETTINVEMTETVLSIGQEVLVVGEKPLFNLEETSSRRSV